jgi:hypothetical protein
MPRTFSTFLGVSSHLPYLPLVSRTMPTIKGNFF